MTQRRYVDALELYRRAHDIGRDPKFLYNEGSALYALGRFPEALKQLEAFRAQAPPELRAQVPTLDEFIAEVQTKVTELIIRSNVRGARILVDHREVGATPLSAPIAVNAGQASIEVAAEGYRSFTRQVELPGGKSLEIEAVLAPKLRAGVLVVKAWVPGARVIVDGKAVGTAPTETSLNPGTHTVLVGHPEYGRRETSVVITSDQRKSITVELQEKNPALTSQWWFWTGLGVLVAAGATAAIIAAESECSPDTGDIPPGRIFSPLVRF
jgi:hypothetical protein